MVVISRRVNRGVVVAWTVVLVGTAMAHRPTAPSGYPRSLTDGKGHTVTLKARPMRIASVVLGVNEICSTLVDPSRIVTMTEIGKDTYVSNVADRIPAGKVFIRDKWQAVNLRPVAT